MARKVWTAEDVEGLSPSGFTASDAVAALSEALDRPYRLVGRLAGGETGAMEISTVEGDRFVLKWELDPASQRLRREGAALAERLRVEAGWPCPEQQVAEVGDLLLVVQAFLAGATVDHLSHDIVDQLFELHDRRIGLAHDGEPDHWAEDMIETLVEGGDGYCQHEPLRTFDPRTRRVIERVEEIGRSLDPADLGGRDIVHCDLHSGNLLQVDGRLSAVVDLDFTQVGDAAFDLTTLALSSLEVGVDQGVRTRLFERGVNELPEPKRRAYVAHLLLRVLDWPIRKHRPAEVEFWLTQADRLLPTS